MSNMTWINNFLSRIQSQNFIHPEEKWKCFNLFRSCMLWITDLTHAVCQKTPATYAKERTVWILYVGFNFKSPYVEEFKAGCSEANICSQINDLVTIQRWDVLSFSGPFCILWIWISNEPRTLQPQLLAIRPWAFLWEKGVIYLDTVNTQEIWIWLFPHPVCMHWLQLESLSGGWVSKFNSLSDTLKSVKRAPLLNHSVLAILSRKMATWKLCKRSHQTCWKRCNFFKWSFVFHSNLYTSHTNVIMSFQLEFCN